jgi:hypothetical protein
MLRNSWVAVQLAASQEGLSSMESGVGNAWALCSGRISAGKTVIMTEVLRDFAQSLQANA